MPSFYQKAQNKQGNFLKKVIHKSDFLLDKKRIF